MFYTNPCCGGIARLPQAIRDGVIDAAMDDAAGSLFSKETTDAYSTSEPQQAFDRRIKFCLDVHNDAVTVRCTGCCAPCAVCMWCPACCCSLLAFTGTLHVLLHVCVCVHVCGRHRR